MFVVLAQTRYTKVAVPILLSEEFGEVMLLMSRIKREWRSGENTYESLLALLPHNPNGAFCEGFDDLRFSVVRMPVGTAPGGRIESLGTTEMW